MRSWGTVLVSAGHVCVGTLAWQEHCDKPGKQTKLISMSWVCFSSRFKACWGSKRVDWDFRRRPGGRRYVGGGFVFAAVQRSTMLYHRQRAVWEENDNRCVALAGCCFTKWRVIIVTASVGGGWNFLPHAWTQACATPTSPWLLRSPTPLQGASGVQMAGWVHYLLPDYSLQADLDNKALQQTIAEDQNRKLSSIKQLST